MTNPERAEVAVLTVDDQPVFRHVVREVIEATPGFEAVGEACSGEEALQLVEAVNADLVLMDVRMPEMDGLETARRMSAEHPNAVIVLISVEDGSRLPSSIESSGAAELVRKQDFAPATLERLWARHGSRPSAEPSLG